MKEEKKKYKNIPFKYLPVGIKICRIVTAALYGTAMIPLIIAIVLMAAVEGMAFIGPMITALIFMIAGLIVLLVSESQLKKKIASGEFVPPEPGQEPEKKQEVKQEQASNNNEVWFCPECGTKNEGAFCSNCGFKKPVAEQNKEVSASKEETPKQEVKSNNTLQKVLHIVIPCAGFGIIAVWLLIGSLLAYIATLVNFFENLSADNSGYFYWGSANSLVGATIIGAMGLVAALIVIIHMVKKFDAMKTMKAYVLVPVAGLAFMFLFCLSETIYLAVLSADVGIKFGSDLYGKLISVMVLGVIAIVLAFISMGFSKKNPLTFRIMIAATMLMSAIPMFILGSMFGEGGTLWAVGPGLIATGILLMLISAGCFFIKPKQ